MAREATVVSNMRITVGNIRYPSCQPQQFQADVTGEKGPTPGSITVTTAGTDVDLGELDTPGLCRIHNQDDTNYVEVGIWDPESLKFYPLLEIKPTESWVMRLSRNLIQEYGSPGTAPAGTGTTRLRIRAYNQSCVVLVEAFEA